MLALSNRDQAALRLAVDAGQLTVRRTAEQLHTRALASTTFASRAGRTRIHTSGGGRSADSLRVKRYEASARLTPHVSVAPVARADVVVPGLQRAELYVFTHCRSVQSLSAPSDSLANRR
jgi:hypothetical protein